MAERGTAQVTVTTVTGVEGAGCRWRRAQGTEEVSIRAVYQACGEIRAGLLAKVSQSRLWKGEKEPARASPRVWMWSALLEDQAGHTWQETSPRRRRSWKALCAVIGSLSFILQALNLQ